MKLSDYDERIYQRIEEKFDRILPYSAVISWLSALAIAFTDIPNYFIYMDVLVGLILIGVYFFRRHLRREIKVAVVIALAMGIGIASFMDGGFSSGAIALILLSNGMAILLLEKRQSIIVAVISVLSLLLLWWWSWKTGFVNPAQMHAGIWIIQILLVILFAFIFRFAAYAIRNHLLENIDELETSVHYANQLAYFDQLTQLPNYLAFSQSIGDMQEKKSISGWMFILSFKNLNIINSIYGTASGDRVLKTGTKYLMDTNKDDELLARTGGNQFAMWIPGTDEAQLNHSLYRIELQLTQAFVDENLSNLLGYYIAYAKVEPEDDSFEDAYRKALLAMTYAKYSNTQNVIAYDVVFEDQLKRDTYLMEQLKKDLASYRHFKVVYQTQVHVDSLEVVGVEALSRWGTKEYGNISPLEFIALINQIGLHREFGYYVLDRVLSDYQKLSIKYHDHITVSINIEPTYLLDARFIDDIEELMKVHSIEGKQLILEITEGIAMNGIDRVNEILRTLRDKGLRISLDDFGTGYSALNYLVNLEVNEVKIDKVLIDSIGTNAKSKVMLKALKELADEFDLRLIAEGVEDEHQYNTIKDIGYKIIQGYYFSKPEDML